MARIKGPAKIQQGGVAGSSLLPEAQELQEFQETYKGRVVIGRDLEVY